MLRAAGLLSELVGHLGLSTGAGGRRGRVRVGVMRAVVLAADPTPEAVRLPDGQVCRFKQWREMSKDSV